MSLIVAPLLIQFVTVPFLGDIDKAGKFYVFAFFVVVIAFFFFRPSVAVKISPVFSVFVLIWLVFFCFSFVSRYPDWTFMQLGIFALCLLFMLLVVCVSEKYEDFFEQLVNSILVAGVIASILGLYEYVHFLVLGPTGSMLIPYLLPPDSSPRVVGLYGQPNLFAVFLTITILAFFVRYLHPEIFSGRMNTSLLRFVPFFLVATVFFQTGSRAGLLSMVLILGVLSWLVAKGKYLSNDKKHKNEFICLIVCLCVAFVVYKIPDLVFISENRSFIQSGISGDARFVFWTSAVLIFLDNPWTGIGLGNYRFLQNSYNLVSHDLLGFVQYEAMGNTNWAHSEIFQLLSEGGVTIVILFTILVVYLLFKFYKNINKKDISNIQILYCNIFILPLVIQSFFSWPFRYPPLLFLFFSFLGFLSSKYPLKEVNLSKSISFLIRVSLIFSFLVLIVLFIQEFKIGKLKRSFSHTDTIEEIIPAFEGLVENPYSRYRVLLGGTPYFVREALTREDNSLAIWLLPYCEQLVEFEGARWQWFNLARLYLKVGREKDSKMAIQETIDLMPSDDRTWAFLHHLNMLKASRETGKPLEEFFSEGHPVDFSELELIRD